MVYHIRVSSNNVFQVGYPQTNQNFEALLKIATDSVIEKGASVSVETPFSLETLLPANLHSYYQYEGSLTVPSCYQSVWWTVFDDPIKISNDQVRK